MSRFNNLKIIAALSAIFMAALFVFQFKKGNQESEITMSLREYLLATLINELPDINKKLPYSIDSNTTLLSIKHEREKILSIYRLSDHIQIDTLAADKKNALIIFLQDQGCRDQTKKNLIDVDIEFIERYLNSKSVTLFEIALNKSACSALN